MRLLHILFRRTVFSILITAVLWAAACGTVQRDPAPQAEITPKEEAAFQEGKKALDNGDPAKAKRLLRSFSTRYPNSRLAPNASMLLGKIAYETGEFEDALSRFAPYLKPHHPPLLRLRANQWTGSIHRVMGNPAKARHHYQAALDLAKTDADRLATLRSLVRMALDRKKYVEAIQYLSALVPLLPQGKKRHELKQRTVDLIFLNLDRPGVELLMQRIESGFPTGYLAVRRAELLIGSKAPNAARDQLVLFLKVSKEHPLEERARKWLRSIETRKILKAGNDSVPVVPMDSDSTRSPKFGPQTIPPISSIKKMTRADPGETNVLNVGVLIPLSGPNAMTGQAGMQGIQLALQHAGAFADQVKLQVHDSSGGDTAGVVRKLAEDVGAVAVLGPFHPPETSAAAKAAEEVEIPIALPLTPTVVSTRVTRYVFRLGVSYTVQAEAVADYGVQTMGLKELAILYPSNAAGRKMSDIFHRRVAALGGRVTRKASYPAGATDFGRQIRALGGMDDQEVERLRKTTEGKGKEGIRIPNIPFRGLFVPDRAAQAALIIPSLGFYNIRGIHLLGISGWSSNEIMTLAKREVEGAYFVGGYGQLPPTARRARFARDFQRVFSKPPDDLSAFAYDAMRVLLSGLQVSGNDRAGLRDQLAKTRKFDGVTGTFDVDATGAARRNLPIMTIADGKIRLAEKRSVPR